MAQAEQQAHPNFLVQGGLVTAEIGKVVARLKREPTWATTDRHGTSLVKGDGINVALMMLKKGAKLQEHHTKAPITVQVIEGRVNFFADGKPHLLTAGTLLALDRAIAHSVEALDESVLILTVGGDQI